MIINRIPALIIIAVLIAGCGQKNAESSLKEGRVLSDVRAVVVSAHPQGSHAGAMIMKKGGNAVDAAVATGFALAVCYPAAGNIGGGGFMLVRTSEGAHDLIDFREKAPLAASRDMYLDAADDVVRGLSTDTHLAAGVPGSVDGMIRIHAKYGKLDFREVIQPSIDLAANGFILTAEQASSLNRSAEMFRKRNPEGCAFVRVPGWKEGDTLRQPDLATTLERIRDYGREGFYSGLTAKLIVEEMKRGNGIITSGDLEQYSAVFRKPLSSSYRGFDIVTCPPPSAGGIILLQMLEMIEPFSPAEHEFHSPEMIHLIAEAGKRAFADRARYAGDADFISMPVQELLNENYLKERMAGFDPIAATPSANIGAGDPVSSGSTETTHFSVVDEEGNAVAVTTTLNGSYGSGIVVKGAGFLLNNEMDDFSVKPGFPNMYGLTGSDANAIEAGKRMLSSMTPVIVEKEGKLFLVAGSPGGSTIPTSVFQVIINLIDYNMTPRAAVDTGRFHHQWLPDRISIEKNSLTEETAGRLQKMGHILHEVTALGRVNAVCARQNGFLEGVADKRGDNSASGY